jgi:LAO/AO transport system kinase
MNFVEKIKAGDVYSVARLITLVERREPEAIKTVKGFYSQCGRAHLVGITGPPGVGKSCLVASLIQRFRLKGMSVGVLAVDPTSPFTGGALLGDRARMTELSEDKEVFIRSFASRGHTGGLSAAVNDAADILDISGKDVVLIETVGVGQGEIDIARLAHTVLLVLMPGYGDTLQAMKAGIMEIADIMVVNKADKPGGDETVAELLTVQNFQCVHQNSDTWVAPIIKTSTVTQEGLDDLTEAILKHFQFIKQQNIFAEKNRKRRVEQFLNIFTQRMRDEFMEELKTDQALQGWVDKIGAFELHPYSAAEQVISLVKEAREGRKKVRRQNN